MATELENLKTRRANVAQELADIVSTSAGGKPDDSATGIAHTKYRLSLYQELKDINAAIDAIAISTGERTFEIHSRAVSR